MPETHWSQSYDTRPEVTCKVNGGRATACVLNDDIMQGVRKSQYPDDISERVTLVKKKFRNIGLLHVTCSFLKVMKERWTEGRGWEGGEWLTLPLEAVVPQDTDERQVLVDLLQVQHRRVVHSDDGRRLVIERARLNVVLQTVATRENDVVRTYSLEHTKLCALINTSSRGVQ